jgi:hypothetical protein
MNLKEEYFNMAIKTLFVQDNSSKDKYIELLTIMTQYLYQSLNIHHLYRYRPDSWERDKNLFNEDEVWFQPMDKQNDPFEFSFKMKSCNELSSFTSERYIASFLNLNSFVESSIDFLCQQFENSKTKYSIACFCEKKDNILLWSHYANSHKGYCIEYSTIDILNTFQCCLLPVIYQSNIPGLIDLVSNNIEIELLPYYIALKSITSKSNLWEYEQEWRIIHSHETGKEKVKFPKPRAVYIGCNATDKLELNLKNACQEKNIPIFKMKKNDMEYKLDCIPINNS